MDCSLQPHLQDLIDGRRVYRVIRAAARPHFISADPVKSLVYKFTQADCHIASNSFCLRANGAAPPMAAKSDRDATIERSRMEGPTVTWVSPLALPGKIGRLEPLSHRHHDDLVEAVQDGELWNLWYTNVPSPTDMQDAIEKRLARLAAGAMIRFAVIEGASAKAVGMTSYLNINSANRRCEIGATWYARRLQGTGLNAECKLLLLSHAFEALRCIAASSARISSITRADAQPSSWAPNWTVYCGAIRSRRKARCATHASTLSLLANGRRSNPISNGVSQGWHGALRAQGRPCNAT